MNLCSSMHIISMLGFIAEAVIRGSWPIRFKILTLNVAIFIVLLHFSNFCFNWFFEHWCQGSNLSRTYPFFTRAKSDALCTSGLNVSHGNLSMAVFLFSSIETTLTAAVDQQSNYLILVLVPCDSYAQYLVRHGFNSLIDLFTFKSTMLLPMLSKKIVPNSYLY